MATGMMKDRRDSGTECDGAPPTAETWATRTTSPQTGLMPMSTTSFNCRKWGARMILLLAIIYVREPWQWIIVAAVFATVFPPRQRRVV